MKYTILTMFFASLYPQSAISAESGQKVEIFIDRIMAPVQGYDDNDNIQIVVDTVLPNACYSQGQNEVRVDAATSIIYVKQFGYQNTSGICENPEDLPGDLKAPVPMNAEVNVGQLRAGKYQIVFQTANGAQSRALQVDVATSSAVDSMRYATVVNAFVNYSIPTDQEEIEVRLTLLLNSSCSVIKKNPQVLYQNDVVVVLPEIEVAGDSACLPVSRPAYKVFKIKNPGVGRHLLHVRSLGGNAKNILFNVAEVK